MNRDLPPRMHIKNNGYYYVRGNRWTLLGHERDAAMARYARVEHGLSAEGNGEPAWRAMATYLPEVFRCARKNAKTREIIFDLTRDQFNTIVARADGRCEVTGIPFQLAIRNSARRPWAPSLDRINASEHYYFGNCRLVCGIVNAAMSDWGEAVFWTMIRRARRKKLRD